MVRADALTPEALIKAMEAGNFYASTGIELEELKVERNTLRVKVKQHKLLHPIRALLPVWQVCEASLRRASL